MTALEIIRSFEKAKNDRVIPESTWEDLLYYGFPRKRGVNTVYQPGDKPSWDVFDDTATQSNLILAAGLSGYMTNSAQRWFELRTRRESLMESSAVKSFFSESADIMYSVFANSNLYQQLHECYIDLGSVGTAAIYEEDDPRDFVRFYARPPKEIYILEDAREEVNMVFRKFTMTSWQAYEFFGKECGATITKCVEEEKDFNKPFEFIQYVCPRHSRDVRKIDNKNKPIASYWVSLADKKIVRESGFEEMPYFCPRFYKNSGEVYGYSALYTCYPDVTMVNKAVETYIKGAEIAIYPPWIVENDGMMGTLDLRAGAINYQRQPMSQGQVIQPLRSGSNTQVGLDFIQRVEDKIRRAFFVDLFLMIAQAPQMTATEVIERTQEKMLIIGPILGRLQGELLNKIIYRTFNILLRRGELPEVPEELQGQAWDVVYVSPLAKAQRAVQARDMQTFLAVVGQMAAFVPEAIDKLKVDTIVDKFGKVYSVDPDIIAGDDEAGEKRAVRAEQMMQAQKMAMLQQGADIAATAGQAEEKFANANTKRKQGAGA